MRRLVLHTRLLVVALLIAALTLVPVLDAMACAFESTAVGAQVAGSAADTADAGEPAGSKDHLPGVCEHNHCHHCSANVLPNLPSAPGSWMPRQLPAGHPRALALADVVDNLMRPPRS